MRWQVCAAALIFAMASPYRLTPASPEPLWPGSRFTQTDRSRALSRGLAFIYRTSRQKKNFSQFGSDYLWCFYEIASMSADESLRSEAAKMGRERAIEWRREHQHVSPDASADEIADVLFGAYAAEKLGFPDDRMKEELRQASKRFGVVDYLGFDPATGPVATGSKLQDLLCDALITSYTADQYGVTLGAPYKEVVKWMRLARPYRVARGEIIPAVNLVTHVVYTTNDYNARALAPNELPEELAFLKEHAGDPDVLSDGELVGEFMDTLRAFGLSTSDPTIQRGFTELLSTQNSDGSWGDVKDHDIYNRYHPTWTAIDGLREYRWTTPRRE